MNKYPIRQAISSYLGRQSTAEVLAAASVKKMGSPVRLDGLKRFSIYNNFYESEKLFQFLADPQKFITTYQEHLIKHDDTTTVLLTSMDGIRMVIKRFNTKSPWHFVRRAFRPTRAENCWHRAYALLEKNIGTAEPVAIVVNRLGPFRGKSWLLTRYVDAPVALDYLPRNQDAEDLAQWNGQLLKSLNRLFSSGHTHGDLKASNILLTSRGPCFIDLDACRLNNNRTVFERRKKKDIQRFLKNWRAHPEIFDYFSHRLTLDKS